MFSLGNNAEIDTEDIYEVLVGACADETSISELCESSDGSPHQNTVLYHLREKLDLTSVERVGDALLQKDVLDTLPEQVEVVADLHLRPYCGDHSSLVKESRDCGRISSLFKKQLRPFLTIY